MGKTSTTEKPKRYFEETVVQNEDVKLKEEKVVKNIYGGDSQNEIEEIVVGEFPRSLKAKFRKQKFPGRAPVNPLLLKKYSRGEGLSATGVKTKLFKEKLQKQETKFLFANEQAARTEILLNEEDGFLIPDEEEQTFEITQDEIVKDVDITSAAKRFDLHLDFGPYRMRYSKNGRYLLLGGKKGHAAGFDWVRKTLLCEMNVMEEIVDVAWLHVETMFALAQKNWVHFYDCQGTELHCVKSMHRATRLEFLPYHFILASGNDLGWLTWLDVSIGQIVAAFNAKQGKISHMVQNPANGVLCVGGSKGVVSMWSPTVKEPLAKLLCHRTSITSVAVDPYGNYMATAGADRLVKLWDIRQLSGPAVTYAGILTNHLDISQKGVLTTAVGSTCYIYKNPLKEDTPKPYLKHQCNSYIANLRFCPYEDIVGIGTQKGFTSILVPGSGEPNFDAREANPYQTKSQRREYEVHALLEKIPSEFIALDPCKVLEIDVPTLKDKVDARKKLLHLKPTKIDYQPRNKAKKRGGAANISKNRKILQEEANRNFHKEMDTFRQELRKEQTVGTEDFIRLETKKSDRSAVLDRFKPKKRTPKVRKILENGEK